MTNLRCALLALLLVGCSRAGSNDDAFQWSNELAPGSVVHILDGAGDVRVARAAGQNALVRASTSWHRGRERDVKFVVNQRGGEYFICAMWRNSGRCDTHGYRGRNTSGFLSMFSLFHRGSDATADVVAELPANVIVDVHVTSGDVQVEGIAGGVTAKTVNGTVRATNVSGPLVLGTVNGDVRLSSDALTDTDPLQLTTTNGSVHAELPAEMAGIFDLSTTNGLVQSDLRLDATGSRGSRHLTGRIGTGERPVRMKTVNGMVTLTTRGDGTSEP
jgi:hypothetical protein